MQGIPTQIFKQIQEAIRLPEGTFIFRYQSQDLFDTAKPGGIILEIPSGQHLFRLERDDALLLHFYHSSPGTGTRVASIDLKALPVAPRVLIGFTWAAKEITLNIGPMVANGKLVSAIGVPSSKQFRVGTDGSVFQIGDQNVEVTGFTYYQGGRAIIQPTALEAWKETVQAIDILTTGQSTEGYIYEVVVANLILVVLVTGFEAYTKRRFLELEQGGVSPNTNELIERFYPKSEREAGIVAALEEEAKTAGVSVLQHIVNRGAINFQNFNKAKDAYNKAYGIKFGELGISSQKIETLHSFFRYRHKIIQKSLSENCTRQH